MKYLVTYFCGLSYFCSKFNSYQKRVRAINSMTELSKTDSYMEDFNLYMSNLDYSNFMQLFKEKGKVHRYKKKDFFITQNGESLFVGWIKNGMFRYTCAEKNGTEHIVGYAFAEEFVCDYSSFISKSASLVNIQAMSDCIVYQLSYQDIIAYWETNIETLRFGKRIADNLFIMIYKQLLATYCDAPEERYLKLMERCPDLKEKVPLKEIASYLRVTPTTISNIRRKITFED